jgi:hypothetical protein
MQTSGRGIQNYRGAQLWGAGNIYRHDYDSVAEEFLWPTVNHSLTPLVAAMETELGA